MPKTKKEASAPPEVVALYDKMVASCPEVPRKGATMPNTSVNGHMFSFIHPSGAVALRLPPGVREEFVEKYETKLYDAYGMIQKEYVLVPITLMEQTDELAPYFKQSWEYVQTLKPKKTAG
jgi:hypothetical protein